MGALQQSHIKMGTSSSMPHIGNMCQWTSLGGNPKMELTCEIEPKKSQSAGPRPT